MILIVGIHTAYAQHELVEKQDGKFFTTISVKPYGFGADQNAAGFIKDLELEVTWWWLFDQPVYYHTLRWTIQDSVKVEPYSSWRVFLRREDLSDYPDLLKRFDELRPLSMEITFDVTLYQMEKSKIVGKFGTYFDSSGSFNYRKTVKNIELMIAKSGQDGENISSGSPEDDFSEFTDYAVKPSFMNSKEKVEQRLKNTFINTGSIVFGNAHVSRLELPNQEVKSIYDAFMARDRGCTKYLDNPRIWTCGVEEKTVKTDDFWNTGGKPDSQPDTEDTADEPSDDFWNNGGVSKGTSEYTRKPRPSEDDFWASGGQDAFGTDSDFWKSGGDKTANAEFEIVSKNDKQGVVASNGRMLIPFRDWIVQSYSDGLANVLISESHELGRCVSPDRRSTSSYVYTYFITATTSGYVDASGEWVIPPERTVDAEVSNTQESAFLGLVLTPANMTDKQKERMERRRERQREREERAWQACKSDINAARQSLISSYRAKGFTVKS